MPVRIPIYQSKLSAPEPAIDGIDYPAVPGIETSAGVLRVPIQEISKGRIVRVAMMPAGGVPCQYILNLHDDYGDGWNGAYLSVFINDESIGDFTVPEDGYEFSTAFSVPFDAPFSLEYSPGDYDEENTYELVLAGETVFSDGPEPVIGEAFRHICGAPPCAVANFTFAGSGKNFEFTDTSTGTPIEWAWNFGDGTTSDIQHPSHAFPDYGDYNVSLTVYDGVCLPSEHAEMISVSCAWAGFDLSRWTPDYPEIWNLEGSYLELNLDYESGSGPFECACQAVLSGDLSMSVGADYWIGSGMPMLESGFEFSGAGGSCRLSFSTSEEWDDGLGNWIYKIWVNFSAFGIWIAGAEIGTIDPYDAYGDIDFKFQRAGNILTAFYMDGGIWQELGLVESAAVAALTTLTIFGGTYWQDELSFHAMVFDPCPEV